jgi:hypothetical protein
MPHGHSSSVRPALQLSGPRQRRGAFRPVERRPLTGRAFACSGLVRADHHRTITAFEAKRDTAARMTTMNNKAVVEALEKAGLVFIPENGGGAGMRLRDRGEI